MSTVKATSTVKKDSTKTATASATKATAKTEKTATAKTSAKPATKSTAKVEKVKAEKAPKAPKAEKVVKERKSRKGITRTFAEDVTAQVSPIINSINAFMSNPEVSDEALKMLRLELRKSVRGTRSTLKTRKASKA